MAKRILASVPKLFTVQDTLLMLNAPSNKKGTWVRIPGDNSQVEFIEGIETSYDRFLRLGREVIESNERETRNHSPLRS